MANDLEPTLVELEPHRAVHVLLARVDGLLKQLTLGRVPEPIVDQLSVARDQFVLPVRDFSVEGDRLECPVRR